MRLSNYLYLLVFPLVVLFFSCRDSKEVSAKKVVAEWFGKEIVFPQGTGCSLMGSATACPDMSDTTYKVLLYTDSVGCTSCRLNLHVWKAYMEEVETIAPGKVDFVFYFQPKFRNELEYILRQEKLEHTVYIDEEDEINRINDFPNEMEYQCFLLDSDNKVVSIGNPVANPKVWEVYKQVFASISKP